MANYAFGAGSLWGVSTSAGVQTPIKFGTLQDVSIETSFSEKQLYGSMQFPVAIARGTGKVTGKAKFAQINGEIYNSLFFGANMIDGSVKTANMENHTVSVGGSVTVSHSATFIADLGVVISSNGVPMVKVSSSPEQGQYSVVAGVYTFNVADANVGVWTSYTYSDATEGKKIVVQNQLLGSSPFFSAYFTTVYNGKQISYQLPRCMSSKLSFATKLEDFNVPEFDFSAFADESGQVMTISTAE